MQKFTSNHIAGTPCALAVVKEHGKAGSTDLTGLFDRHFAGDWGEVCQEDWQANDAALLNGSRVLSAYALGPDAKVWIITEAEGDNGAREATTILLPEEY